MTRDELLAQCKRVGIIPPPTLLVKISVAAEILGMSVSTLNQRAKQGRPPERVRFGGQYRYHIDELVRVLNGES